MHSPAPWSTLRRNHNGCDSPSYWRRENGRCIARFQDIPKSVQTVLLAIKPQLFADIGKELGAALPVNTLIVSILAGTSLRRLDEAFDGRVVIRAMPNTPAAIGAGISAIYVDPNVAPEKIEDAEALLKPGGEVVRVDSKLH